MAASLRDTPDGSGRRRLVGILERDGAVEDGGARLRVLLVGAKIAGALELEMLAALRRRERGLHVGGDGLERIRVQVLEERFGAVLERIRDREEVRGKTDLGLDAGRNVDPVDGALHLAAVRRIATPGMLVIGAVDFGDAAVQTLGERSAGEKAGA